jgi:hypothetical protein
MITVDHSTNSVWTSESTSVDNLIYAVGLLPPRYPPPDVYQSTERWRMFGAWYIDWSTGQLIYF